MRREIKKRKKGVYLKAFLHMKWRPKGFERKGEVGGGAAGREGEAGGRGGKGVAGQGGW